jgi:hypothetical protein
MGRRERSTDRRIGLGLKAKGNDDEIFDNSIRNMFFNKRDGAGFAAQGRQQAAGSGETEGANGL